MIENYFGLIEAIFVFGLAIAFYLWQRHSLKRDERLYQERLLQEKKEASGGTGTTGHSEGQHRADER